MAVGKKEFLDLTPLYLQPVDSVVVNALQSPQEPADYCNYRLLDWLKKIHIVHL